LVFAYVLTVCQQYSELHPLALWLEKRVAPHLMT
jgi:hypothetical protein